MVRLLQQLFRFGPKYGMSRGIAMYVRDSDIRGQPDMLVPERLPGWMSGRGQVLTYSQEGLEAADRAVDDLSRDRMSATMLDLEVGKFVGVVLVSRVDGARWHAWPNGHPVVRLADGRDIDVLAVASRRISTGSPRLTEVLCAAM